MKRTLSGELAPTPSQTRSVDEQHADINENQHQQQAAAANDGVPTMHTPDANNPTAENPLPGFDAGGEMTDLEKFAQMLPHTPPVEKRRDVQEDDDVSSSEDELSGSEPSSDDSSDSNFDEDTIALIREDINSGSSNVTIRNLGIREVTEILELCKQDARVIGLQINSSKFEIDFQLSLLTKMLIEFFEKCHSVQSFEYLGTEFGLSSIDASLLSAIFRNNGISRLRVADCSLITSSPNDSEALIQSIKHNTSLKSLQLEEITIPNPDLQIADALTENSSLEELDIGIDSQRDIYQSLADHLNFNQQLKILNLGPQDDLTTADLRKVFAAVKDHPALECLNAQRICFLTLLEGDLIRQLIGNRNLKILLLPKASDVAVEAVDALIELAQHHPTLTSIHLGSLPRQHRLRMKLACGLKSSQRLDSIGVSFMNFSGTGIARKDVPLQMIEFAKEIGNIPTLRKVRFDAFSDLDCLSEFLKSCPQIREVDLPHWVIEEKDQREKLLSIVKQSEQITHFPEQGNENCFDDDLMQFRKELNQALWINQQIELSIEAASAAMKKLLDEKSRADDSLPIVPRDVTDELAKAIARHVPPEKAKAIFDELIVHAPSDQKAM